VPSAEGAQVREGIKQDHHYERDEQNATKEPVHEEELAIKQEKPANIPTPDGTLPPKDVPVATTSAKPVNADVAQQRTDAQPKQEIVSEDASAQKAIPTHEAVPEQDKVPEGINTDVFHSPRIAKMLGGRTIDGRRMGELRLREAAASQSQDKGINKDTFNLRNTQTVEPVLEPVKTSTSTSASQVTTETTAQTSPTKEELQDFAASLASDATGAAGPDATAEVSLPALDYNPRPTS